MIAAPASAVVVREQAGSHIVSFNIPVLVTTDIQSDSGETYNGVKYTMYKITSKNVDNAADIALVEVYSYDQPMGEITEQQAGDIVVSFGFPKPTTMTREVDGKVAVMAMGTIR